VKTDRPILCDANLARRLEAAEGAGCASYVDARARISPEVGACWIQVGGTRAMFDGPVSPLTQTFGLGLFDEVNDSHLDRLEDFFTSRGAPVFHEVSPLADVAVLALLNRRGYRPIELTSVMFQPIEDAIDSAAALNPGIRVRVASESDHELWARTAATGWSDFPDLEQFLLDLSRVAAARANGVSFLAEVDGIAAAAAALTIIDGVAILAGASTVPKARRQGAQRALLDARLQYGGDHGCDLAMMCALPGSASQRNAERHGFRIAYTRIKWQLQQG
jgi:GNAT superfamily N-acetyltransferase